MSSYAPHTKDKITIEIYCENGIVKYIDGKKLKYINCKVKKYKLNTYGFNPIHRSIKGFRNWLLYDKPHLCEASTSIKVLDTIIDIYNKIL